MKFDDAQVRSFNHRWGTKRTEPRMMDDLHMVKRLESVPTGMLHARWDEIQRDLDDAVEEGRIGDCEGPWGQWLTLEQQACLDVIEARK